ncbi:hypothetical protein [Pectobacterium betavasculorum]|uniref:hypothetical protein n=1 Tax=Pectobacterium betavasculorum TaxID=55207 RepID=UPI00313CD4C5
MKCKLLKEDNERKINITETAYGFPVITDEGVRGYFVLFPKTSEHADIRIFVSDLDVEITDSTTSGEEAFL